MKTYHLIRWDNYRPRNKYGKAVKSGRPTNAIVCGPHAAERSKEYLSTREERLKDLERATLNQEQ